MLASVAAGEASGTSTVAFDEDEELVEKDIRERFKRMCEGYFDNVAKKLIIEHKVRRSAYYLKAGAHHRRPSGVLLRVSPSSVYTNKIAAITRPISAQAKYSRIGSKHTRR